MKTKTSPSTVRLTPSATAALIELETKHRGVGRAALVEMSLLETVILTERLPITEDDFELARFIFRYLVELAEAHTKGPNGNAPQAKQVALAAKTTAHLIKRVFSEAKGRITLAEK